MKRIEIYWNKKPIVAVSHHLRHNEGLSMKEYFNKKPLELLKETYNKDEQINTEYSIEKSYEGWNMAYVYKNNSLILIKTLYKKN